MAPDHMMIVDLRSGGSTWVCALQVEEVRPRPYGAELWLSSRRRLAVSTPHQLLLDRLERIWEHQHQMDSSYRT